MSNYWSLSPFADKLRRVLRMPEHPSFGTMDMWKKYHKNLEENYAFRSEILDSLDIVQKIVNFPVDTYDSIVYTVSNWLKNNHVLRTRTKPGNWGDLTSRIPDALMFAVIDFIEDECFWMNILWNDDRSRMSDEVWKWRNSSRFYRKFFKCPIDPVVRANHGKEYIKFQMENSDDASVEGYKEILAAYEFAKHVYFDFDAYKHPDIPEDYVNKCFESGEKLFTIEEQMEIHQRIREIEEEFADQVTLHCSNLVKNRAYLWT